MYKKAFLGSFDVTSLKNDRGASAVEMAIVLPLLLILLFGIIEFGLVLYDKAVITNASREGARFGIVSRSPRYESGDIDSQVQNYCVGRLVTFPLDGEEVEPPVVTTNPSDTSDAEFGDDLEVLVRWTYRFLLLPDLPGIGLSDTITLSARTVMKYE